MEPNTPITLAVAAYTDPLFAQQDFTMVWESIRDDGRRLAVAELTRDAAGTLRVARHRSEPMNPAWGSALLAAALVFLIAPAGAGFLTAVPAVGGAGAVTRHFHRTVSRRERDLASDLLEQHDAGLVIVATDRPFDDVKVLLQQADESMAMMTKWNGLDRAIEQEIAEAQVNPSGT